MIAMGVASGCVRALLRGSQATAACAEGSMGQPVPTSLIVTATAWQPTYCCINRPLCSSSCLQHPDSASQGLADAGATVDSSEGCTPLNVAELGQPHQEAQSLENLTDYASAMWQHDTGGFVAQAQPAPQNTSIQHCAGQQQHAHQLKTDNRSAEFRHPELPGEKARVLLKQAMQEGGKFVQLDAYSLSRSLVHEQPLVSSSPAAQQPQQQLAAADKEVLEKFVGILTKDGKKSRARRLLLDAMHIMKHHLHQGQAA